MNHIYARQFDAKKTFKWPSYSASFLVPLTATHLSKATPPIEVHTRDNAPIIASRTLFGIEQPWETDRIPLTITMAAQAMTPFGCRNTIQRLAKAVLACGSTTRFKVDIEEIKAGKIRERAKIFDRVAWRGYPEWQYGSEFCTRCGAELRTPATWCSPDRSAENFLGEPCKPEGEMPTLPASSQTGASY